MPVSILALYQKHRPMKLNEVIGQDKAVNAIRKDLLANKFPHASLLNGPTGTGKTTLMRIIRRALKCHKSDYIEINTANFRGIDTIKGLHSTINLMPIGGTTRVIGIDECHMMTKEAQNAILKMLEETPEHVYFILGTTDPQKLLTTVTGRCTEYKLRAVPEQELGAIVKGVCAKEGFTVSDSIIFDIAVAANGSARKALVILDAVAKEEGDEAQGQAISITTVDKDAAFALAKELMWPGRAGDWSAVAAVLQRLATEEPEGVRHMVLAFARSCLVGKEGKAPNMKNVHRAALLIDNFGTHFFDSKQAGLAYACYRTVFAK